MHFRFPPASGRTALALLATCLLLDQGCKSAAPVLRLPEAEDTSFAFREPGVGVSLHLSGRQQELLDEGFAAFRRGDLQRAEKLLRKGGSKNPSSPFELGLAYVAVREGRKEDARALLDRLLGQPAPLPAAVEAAADLHASDGELREAFDGYRAFLRLLPRDARGHARLGAVRAELVKARKADAEQALQARDLDAARRAGLSLVEIDPKTPAGYQVLARAAEAGQKVEDAYIWSLRARALAPKDAAWNEIVAGYAMRARRFTEAIALYEELAAASPRFARNADEARLEFEIQNLPEPAQKAARSQRLTRAQAAVLLWWLVPEVREMRSPPATDVAVDAVDRGDRAALIRAISLGFFAVSHETHRVGAEAPISRVEFAGFLKRLAQLVSRRPGLPPCLAESPPSSSALADCGILPSATSRVVAGKEAVWAIQKAARAGREGSPE